MRILLLISLALTGHDALGQSPRRVISLDYCADQYVLQFVPRKHIAGISPEAKLPFSYLRDRAEGLPVVKPLTEDVVLRKPDLVVRSYGGGPNINGFLGQLQLDVLQLPPVNTLQDIRATLVDTATRLDQRQAGVALLATVDARLQRIQKRLANPPQARPQVRPQALYTTPGGVTSGPGTLVDQMLTAAGLLNYQTQPGWHPLPLERMVFSSPDILAMAFFESFATHPDIWSVTRHAIMTKQQGVAKTVPLQGAWTACGGWFLIDAIEALHNAHAGPAE